MHPTRECGGCTACCYAMEVYTETVRTPCWENCEHQIDAGCAIYEDRPYPCRKFNCGWLFGIGIEEDRPDKNGILLFNRPMDSLDGAEIPVAHEVWLGASSKGRGKTIIKKVVRAKGACLVVRPDGSRRFWCQEIGILELFRSQMTDEQGTLNRNEGWLEVKANAEQDQEARELHEDVRFEKGTGEGQGQVPS